MPPTEPCVKGVENEMNIKALKETFEDFRDYTRDAVSEIQKCTTKLTNHYSKKPSWFVLIVISGLFTAVSAMGVYIITL